MEPGRLHQTHHDSRTLPRKFGAGERASAVMSRFQSAKLDNIDPWAYLRDVLARIQSHSASRIVELLPHRWQPR